LTQFSVREQRDPKIIDHQSVPSYFLLLLHDIKNMSALKHIEFYVTNCKFIKYEYIYFFLFFFWRKSPQWAMASSFTRFLDHTQRHTTVGRTPLDGWWARRRDLYMTTNNTHNKHPCPRWDTNPNLSRWLAAEIRLKPRGQWALQ
jgi:hypothetical protein